MTPTRRVPWARRAIVPFAAIAVVLSACTVQQNQQYQVDLVVAGYHVHLYRQTTMMVWLAHDVVCGYNAACTLQVVWKTADANGILPTLAGASRFFDDDVADFDDALRSTPHPWPLNVNEVTAYGCLGGHRNIINPYNDGDWYGDAPSAPWCAVGAPL